MIALTLGSTLALAWDCDDNGGACGCQTRGGDSQTYHILAADFTSGEEADIESGANTWDAGTSDVNMGADWDYVRGTDVTSWGHTNLRFDVAAEDDAWFTAEGVPAGHFATTLRREFGCTRLETDIVFRSSASWSTSLPSLTTSASPSIGQVAIHEFGHDLGLNHNDGELAIMNAIYPHSGDGGDQFFRLHEDDYDFLVTEYGDASTGNNLLVTRFADTGVGTSDEIWTTASESGKDWSQAAGTCLGGTWPSSVYVDSNSTTASLTSVEVRWTLSTDTFCGDADDIEIDVNSYTFSQGGSSSTVTPSAFCIPSGTASASYYLCAEVDSSSEVTETSTFDNSVHSEKLFVVP
jgi:hypothetical protein